MAGSIAAIASYSPPSGRFRNETGNEDVRRLFNTANTLHTNFYEDWKDGQTVAEDLDDVEQLLNLLEPLLG